MGYIPTTELIRQGRKKKWCAVTQSKYRENEAQYLYEDCAYQREPEPHEFPHGIGLHYPVIPEKGSIFPPQRNFTHLFQKILQSIEKSVVGEMDDFRRLANIKDVEETYHEKIRVLMYNVATLAITQKVDYTCEDVCEDEAKTLSKREVGEIPLYMQPVTSSYDKNTRHVLVFPHRNRPPFRHQPNAKSLVDRYMNMERFQGLTYAGLDYIQSCLSFESILDKLNTSGTYLRDTKARAIALRLLLQLPPQDSRDLEDQPTTTGRVHNRIYLSAKGKHHRVLTPRCDASIVEQMGRANAIILLQKCLRGKLNQISIEKTRTRWEESYEELNGFSISYQVDPQSGIELITFPTEMTVLRAYTGQYISPLLEPLLKPNAEQSYPVDTMEKASVDDEISGSSNVDDGFGVEQSLWGGFGQQGDIIQTGQIWQQQSSDQGSRFWGQVTLHR